MNLVSKKWVIGLLTRLVVIVIVAKAAALGLLWFLPGEGVGFQKEQSTQPAYQRYVFAKAPKQEYRPAGGGSISSGPQPAELLLKGIYKRPSGGYAILARKSDRQSGEVVAVGEEYSGYTLVELSQYSARLERSGQSYTLTLEQAKATAMAAEAKAAVAAPSAPGEPHKVAREEIDRYAKNFDQIWKDIGIQEVRKGEQIEGFRVTRIRAGSPFAQLGLRRGDVIIKANNKELKSYGDAMEIYQKINTVDALELVVLRNNQEKELFYEIH